ncbi:MAG: hypothetical protein ACE5RC_06740, partial [Nitrosopumilus sp.]
VPKIIISDVPNEFEIKFHYVGEPYVLYDLTPIINVNPESAIPFVKIETTSSELQPSVPGRIPVTITVDKNISHQKIFLSVSYEALGYGDKQYKSSWSDFLILEIGENQDYTIVETPKLPEKTCKEEHVLIYKYNKTPTCVTYQTGQKLVKRGWATCDDGISHDRGHPCGPHSSGVVSFDSYKAEPEPEKTSGTFYPRIHMSIFPNTESTQYVEPDFVTIGPGSQVTWSNYDDVPVSLNSVDPDNMWATSVIPPDGYDTVTFEETGIYEYKGNAGIHGFIIVMDDDGQLLESKFSEVFGPGSPLMYNEELEPVLLYDNCKRYVYWLNEHGHKDIHVPEDYPRYPPWGNQIFPLVEFCTFNGNIVNAGDENSVHWEFKIENEN